MQGMIKELKTYQTVEKLSFNEQTGYAGVSDKEVWIEINQLINSNLIPLFIFLIKNDRLTNVEVSNALNSFFEYLYFKKIDEKLDTEDKEELNRIIMQILIIIKKEHLPISV